MKRPKLTPAQQAHWDREVRKEERSANRYQGVLDGIDRVATETSKCASGEDEVGDIKQRIMRLESILTRAVTHLDSLCEELVAHEDYYDEQESNALCIESETSTPPRFKKTISILRKHNDIYLD